MFRQRAFLAGGVAVCGLGAAVVASSARGWAGDQSKKQGDEKGSGATTRPYQCTKTTASAQLCSVVRIENFLSDEEIQRVIGWWIAHSMASHHFPVMNDPKLLSRLDS